MSLLTNRKQKILIVHMMITAILE